MATIALLGGEIDLIGSENPSVSVGSDNIEERGILDYQNDVYLGSPLREYSIAGDVDDVDDDDNMDFMVQLYAEEVAEDEEEDEALAIATQASMFDSSLPAALRERSFSWDVNFQQRSSFLNLIFDIDTLHQNHPDEHDDDDDEAMGVHMVGSTPARTMDGMTAPSSSSILVPAEPDIYLHLDTPATSKTKMKKLSANKAKAKPIPNPNPPRSNYTGVTNGKVGDYTIEERQAIIARFREKKEKRIWKKQIKYVCRKKLAETRPRFKGRFVPRTELSESETADTSSGIINEATTNSNVAIIKASAITKEEENFNIKLESIEPSVVDKK